MPKHRPSIRQLWRSDQIVAYLNKNTMPPDSVYEVGPEHGWTGVALRESFPEALLDAVEIWPAYVELCEYRRCYDEITQGDVFHYIKQIDDDRYRLSIACDVVEHMTKDQGLVLLAELDRVGILSIVTMPIGWMDQGAIDGNPHQAHKSGWTVQEMKDLGWDSIALSDQYQVGIYVK